MRYKITAQIIESIEQVKVILGAEDIMQALNFARKEFIRKQIAPFRIIKVEEL